MLRYVLLDELDQNRGHLFALAGSGCLEGIVQFNSDVNVQAFELLVLLLRRFHGHLLSARDSTGIDLVQTGNGGAE